MTDSVKSPAFVDTPIVISPGIIGYPRIVPELSTPIAAALSAPATDLACPACRGALRAPGETGPQGARGPGGASFECAGCGASFESRGGVPVLLPPGSSLLRDQQAHIHDDLSRLHNARKRPLYWSTPFHYAFNFLMVKHARMLARLRPRPGERHLDVGCQDGMILSQSIRKWGVRGTGVDVSEASLRLAVERNAGGARYFLADAQCLPFAGGSFDLAHSVGTMEHVPDQQRYVAELARVLRPGGRVLFDMINRRDALTVHGLERWWAARRGRAEAALQASLAIGHDPATFRESGAVRAMCEREGLRVRSITHYNAVVPLLVDSRLPRLVAALRGQATDFHGRGLGEGAASGNGSGNPGAAIPAADPAALGLLWRRAATLALKGALPLAEAADWPLTALRYSNTFYVIADKPSR
jgi:SAM-dependent methyltransferase